MRALFSNASVWDDKYFVHVLHCAKPMSDGNGCAAFLCLVKSFLNNLKSQGKFKISGALLYYRILFFLTCKYFHISCSQIFYPDLPEQSGGAIIVCNKCRVTKNYFWKRSYLSKKKLSFQIINHLLEIEISSKEISNPKKSVQKKFFVTLHLLHTMTAPPLRSGKSG